MAPAAFCAFCLFCSYASTVQTLTLLLHIFSIQVNEFNTQNIKKRLPDSLHRHILSVNNEPKKKKKHLNEFDQNISDPYDVALAISFITSDHSSQTCFRFVTRADKKKSLLLLSIIHYCLAFDLNCQMIWVLMRVFLP